MKTRAINLGFFLLTSGLLLALSIVTPSVSGFGTHQQIIPVPCLFQVVLQRPCPSCGLTTSLSNLIHGNFFAAIGAHPFGLIVLILIIMISLLSLWGLIAGKEWWNVLKKGWLQITLICGISIYLLSWFFRLLSN